MPMTVGTSGGNKVVGAVTVGTAGGNKAVLVGTIGTAGGNKVFYAALTASASPNGVSGTNSLASVTSNTTTATPSGGIGPYTYQWLFSSGDNLINITSPTTATTAFQKTMAPATMTAGDFFCRVTDTATGIQADTNLVSVTLERI